MVTDIIDCLKPLTDRQKVVLFELVMKNDRLRKRIMKELKMKGVIYGRTKTM